MWFVGYVIESAAGQTRFLEFTKHPVTTVTLPVSDEPDYGGYSCVGHLQSWSVTFGTLCSACIDLPHRPQKKTLQKNI